MIEIQFYGLAAFVYDALCDYFVVYIKPPKSTQPHRDNAFVWVLQQLESKRRAPKALDCKYTM
ncbi:MAG: hypothetical protein Marn2KO_00840 [Marinobacter nauticus]